VELVNQERTGAGVAALRGDERLAEAAQIHAEQLAAAGQQTADQAVESWMSSPPHRANILNTTFTDAGAGVATDSTGRPYYVQVSARP
jgi:uncharacterized protein YkwD